MTQPQEQALCPEDVLRKLEKMNEHYATVEGRNAATLIRQMQAAIAEADRRANDLSPLRVSKPIALWVAEPLAPFLPKPEPDPLVDAMRQALPASMPDHHVAAIVRNLTAYCDKHGGTLTWKDGE